MDLMAELPKKRKPPKGYRVNRRRLARALARARKRQGITLREQCREAGVYDHTIRQLDHGAGPSLENYARLCAWLGVEPGEFFD